MFGVASGYAAITFNAFYTLASVPLALHYLTDEEFGLWALVTQVVSYLLLIEIGITGAVSRFLLDHKDHKEAGQYGSVIKTGCLVLAAQGLVIAVGGLLISFGLKSLFPNVSHELLPIFQFLVAAQCVLVGVFFCSRVLMGILQAHQRFDVLNYTLIVQLVIGFAVQWFGFHAGWKLHALLAANFASFLCGVAVNYWSVKYLKLFPPAQHWGHLSLKAFREMFAFGSELFMLAMGLQLLNGSQVVIISRTLGLPAAAIWTIATKTYALAFQFVQRIFDFSVGALGEMMVRGERATLRRRYRDILMLTAAMAVFVNASVAVGNASFLNVWVHRWAEMNGASSWPWWNDALMGVLMLLNCITRCQIGLLGYAKEIGGMRWIYFLEGACFVVASLMVARPFGTAGIILVATGQANSGIVAGCERRGDGGKFFAQAARLEGRLGLVSDQAFARRIKELVNVAARSVR